MPQFKLPAPPFEFPMRPGWSVVVTRPGADPAQFPPGSLRWSVRGPCDLWFKPNPARRGPRRNWWTDFRVWMDASLYPDATPPERCARLNARRDAGIRFRRDFARAAGLAEPPVPYRKLVDVDIIRSLAFLDLSTPEACRQIPARLKDADILP